MNIWLLFSFSEILVCRCEELKAQYWCNPSAQTSGRFCTCFSRNKSLFWENNYLGLAEKNTEQVGDKYLPRQIISHLWANYTQRWALIKVSRPPSTHHPLWMWFSWSPRWLWAVWFCLAHQCCRGPLTELPNKLKCVHCVKMTDEPSILWPRVLSHS